MKTITIKTSSDEQTLLEYYLFQYKGSQIAMNQYLTNTKYDYSHEHIKRIGNKLTKKRNDLNDYAKEVISAHGYEELLNKNIAFDIYPSMLVVYLRREAKEVPNGNTR